jgi:iron only hydrogenase large subunit-like protein
VRQSDEVFEFGDGNGIETAGRIVTALCFVGFTKIFNVSFARGDIMIIVEEVDESGKK